MTPSYRTPAKACSITRSICGCWPNWTAKIYLAVEHLTLPDVPTARDYVLAQFDKM